MGGHMPASPAAKPEYPNLVTWLIAARMLRHRSL